MLDLKAYLARIGYEGGPEKDLATLQELHWRHPLAIPFENLSTLIGETVSLDLATVQSKLVERRRGGYCFEQNTLFKAVLEHVGFTVTPLAARVIWNEAAGFVNPRTHMVLLVDIGLRCYLADVGFGGATLTAPLEFVVGAEQETPHETFRLAPADGEFELQVQFEGSWRPMYRFDLQAQLPVDYEVLNHYVATHPESHFRTRLMAGRPTAGGRYALGNGELKIYGASGIEEERELASVAELKQALTGLFGIRLPEDTRLDAALERIAAARQRLGGSAEAGFAAAVTGYSVTDNS